MKLYNTLTRQLEEFKPITDGKVGMYCCGPTVYSYAHIGNLRTYLNEDFLHRTLVRAGYDVHHVMNITDVGHLTSDEDTGEDKMLKAAEKEKMDVLALARKYENFFFDEENDLNIIRPSTVCRATEHVQDMIEFVKKLEEKGLAYVAGGNVYFDTLKFGHYGELSHKDIEGLQHGARVEEDPNKRNPTDFVLWFTSSKFENQILQWDSPWGRGYPGWHIECSVMSSKYLGEYIDIHCGGIDHISVHHENEKAQSEGCFGHKWVNYWVHNAFLQLKDVKMSKSLGNILTTPSLKEKGYNPLAYRYLALTAHYRSELQFTWEALDAAQAAFNNLKARVIEIKKDLSGAVDEAKKAALLGKFDEAIFNDVATPQALAVMWEVVKDAALNNATKWAILSEIDTVFGLKMDEMKEEAYVPDAEVQALLDARKAARAAKDWAKSDEIRDALKAKGLAVKDLPDGSVEIKQI
ncbi:MAG: cysteine--tRNA ligase [Alphaproteobacteria bacterium]|nr:cysteine--tRNA ligase [Alphaproteobacteria bacterium]